MDVIFLPIHLYQCCLEVHGEVSEDTSQGVDGLSIEHTTTVLSGKDQVNMQVENTVAAVPNIAVFLHRPKVNYFP
jgi:hypothetical protein